MKPHNLNEIVGYKEPTHLISIIKELQGEKDRAIEERHLLIVENRKLKFALEEIVNLSFRWPDWDYQDLYQVSKDTANIALGTNL